MTEKQIVETIRQLLPKPGWIVDDLKDHTMADYQEARQFFLEEIRQCPGIHFVGQFGTVSAPGVSDIDMLVIVDDEHFQIARTESRRIIQQIPDGPYLFWHWEVLLPRSLVAVSSALRRFDGLQFLLGETSIVKTLTTSNYPLSAITTIIWNSYMWRSVLNLRGSRHLRQLLLLLGNVIHSLAGDYRILAKSDEGAAIQAWGREIREEILTRPREQRKKALIYFFQQAIRKWMETDWQIQEWWTDNVRPIGSENGFRFSVGPRRVFRFRDRLNCGTITDGFWRQSIDRINSKINGTVLLDLPVFYLQIAFAVKDVFPPASMPQPIYRAQVSLAEEGWEADWQQAIETYREAIRSVRRTAAGMKMDEDKLISNPFIAPFSVG